MATSSSRQNSRFSTLKVFKFNGAQKPPPPPPKDPYYLANPSLASLSQSLSPEVFSPPFGTQPGTPMSAGYTSSARSPSPTPSYTPSYNPTFAASRSTLAPSTSSHAPESSSSRKGSFFKLASLGKRSKSSKSGPSTPAAEYTPDPVDDPSISLPWNFQHNVHVDEAFAGLPPTWSASLAEMGFSEEEIASIHARRAASRPTLYALRSERPESPASSTFSRARPNPRSSSLMQRDVDSISQRSESSYAADISQNISISTDYSDTSTSETTSSPFTTPTRSTRLPETRYFPPQQTPSSPPLAGPSCVSPVSSSKDSRPRTPTKRSYHVTNDSIGTMASPPPAYWSPKTEPSLSDAEELALPPAAAVQPMSRPTYVQQTSEWSTEGEESVELEDDVLENTLPAHRARLSTLPPRISLHQDSLSDLANWTESLFSILPSSSPPKAVSASPSDGPQSAASSLPTIRKTPPLKSPPAAPSELSSPIRQRQLPLQKPLALQVQSGKPTPPPSPSLPPIPSSSASSNPLWREVYEMVRPPESDTESPALSALFSPGTRASASPATSVESRFEHDELQVEFSRDKENRDSNMSTMTVTPATIVRHVSVVKRARANVIQSPPRSAQRQSTYSSITSAIENQEPDDNASARSARSNSPVSSSESNSSEASSLAMSTMVPDVQDGSPTKWKTSSMLPAPQLSSIPYVETSPQPSPRVGEFDHASIITTASVRGYRESEEAAGVMQRPSIVIDDLTPSMNDEEKSSPWSSSSASPSPSTPALRYSGWVTEVVASLKAYINETVDPRSLFVDLTEVAEGESGSVFAARVSASVPRSEPKYVAIKQVALVPTGSSKLADLERELQIMKDVRHPQILSMDSLYIDFVEDSLWISMELMDRSLADVLALADEGVELTEGHIARFVRDVLMALNYLQARGIAHRDVRSDNLLVNHSGIVKLADFSSAVQVSKTNPTCTEPAGVIYWQAPEMRSGSYNALKVDIWSLGATIWELAQAQPPFADATDASQLGDTWPPLDQPHEYSRSFHDFLSLCSQPCSSRPNPDDLLNTPLIHNATDRSAIVELLAQCRLAEENVARRESLDS